MNNTNYNPQSASGQPQTKAATATYSTSMARLEAIVAELNNTNLELEKAIALFKEGMQLSAECQNMLDHFQQEIDSVMPGRQENQS